jgi:hypothetical protein
VNRISCCLIFVFAISGVKHEKTRQLTSFFHLEPPDRTAQISLCGAAAKLHIRRKANISHPEKRDISPQSIDKTYILCYTQKNGGAK